MAKENKAHKNKIEQLIASKKAHLARLSPQDVFKKIRKGDKSGLAEGITLLESTKNEDIASAQELLKLALPYSGESIRIGITGVPGVGKSTLIESLGSGLRTFGDKVATISNVADASTATNEFTSKVKTASAGFDNLSASFEKATANLKAMGESNVDSQAYHDQVNNLAKNKTPILFSFCIFRF